MWPNLQETAALVTITEETLNGKLHLFFDEYLFQQENENYYLVRKSSTILVVNIF